MVCVVFSYLMSTNTTTHTPGSLLSSSSLACPHSSVLVSFSPLVSFAQFKPSKAKNVFTGYLYTAAHQAWWESDSLHPCKSRQNHPLLLSLIIFFLSPPKSKQTRAAPLRATKPSSLTADDECSPAVSQCYHAMCLSASCIALPSSYLVQLLKVSPQHTLLCH